ncbi:MAG: metal ABC transporter substrate-binding protein [Rhizobiaceae bacterium]|nr:metal ABC transporter substrate-binding protein [Rhizobiaceae bacterium]
MKKLFSVLLFASLALAAIPASAHEKLKVVASFSILGDMVRHVTGELAEVTTIVGPDADAHVYAPSTSDARAVADADVVFVNAMGFETWSQALIESSGTKAKIFVATEGVTKVKVDGEVDPHAWNSLPNGMIYVANIAKFMAESDPDHAADYMANAEKYTKRLQALHDRAVSDLAKLPSDKKTVVTAHDAFGYLENAYGLTFLAPVGIDTEAEPSAKEMAALIDQLKEAGAGALFVENITSPALIEQISRETGIKIGGRLFSDALSERGGPATSYEAMFEHNLNTIIQALSQQS